MSLPITIEGQKYFVTMPSLADFRNCRQFLARKKRRELGEMIPPGLPDDELERRLEIIGRQCDDIDPFTALKELLATPDGSALFFYGWLRIENPNVTLQWVEGFVARCDEGKPAALDGLRELREAMNALYQDKKKEAEKENQPKEEPLPAAGQSISTPSTSP